MSDISTRIWLDEKLWNQVRARALAGGITVRELIPQLVSQALSKVLAAAQQPAPPATAVTEPAAPAASSASAESGPPVIALSDVYRCGVCGVEVRLGGLNSHMGKHLKEKQALEAERS